MLVELYVFYIFEFLYNLALHTLIYTFTFLYIVFLVQSKLIITLCCKLLCFLWILEIVFPVIFALGELTGIDQKIV